MKIIVPFVLLTTLFATATPVHSQSMEWVRQLGTTGDDVSNGVSADELGNVYITGRTNGSLGGANAGNDDAFISKYDASGAILWTRQLGSNRRDRAVGVSADGLGNVYISGLTEGSLGGTNAGGDDAFISKYDASGALQWTRQLGTNGSETGYGVSADGLGNVYISGATSGSLGGASAGSRDAFVSKYDANGAIQWTRQLGTSSGDSSLNVSADALGNVYISGGTFGSLGAPNAGSGDPFVSKYDASGALQWTQQLGDDGNEAAWGVSADGLGNVYLSASGSDSSFLSKYDTSGTLQWTRPRLPWQDSGWGVSADRLGNVYVSGGTKFSPTDEDIFINKYNAAGVLQWTQFQSTSEYEFGRSVSTDGSGNIYVTGQTGGDLGAANAGGQDAFLTKLFDSSIPNADFNADGLINCRDVDLLVSEIAGAYHGASFDLTGDGLVEAADLDRWLTVAGAANLPTRNPYLPGDANLDGVVDVSDFNIWNGHRLTQTAAWCSGDFNADGFVDVPDFNVWNALD